MTFHHFQYKGILPLLIEGNKLYYSKFNNKIYSSFLPELTKETLITRMPISLYKRIFGKIPLFNKIMRIGPHNLSFAAQTFQISMNHRIITIDNDMYISFSNFEGSRPLNIEYAKGRFYFGEYFSNPGRKVVKIFSCDASKKNWEVAYTFPENSIRHIHSIQYDSFRDGFWILTGDRDQESVLWFTTDFQNLEAHGDWTQKSRAVKIIPTKDYLIVPMDTPQQKNYINYYYPKEKKFEQVAELPGSAFHAEEIGEYYFVSTVVEPSVVNKTDIATIFVCSKNSSNWKELFSAKKNTLPIKYSNYYRYPELVIVPVQGKSKYLVVFGRSLKNFEAKVMVWDTSLLQ